MDLCQPRVVAHLVNKDTFNGIRLGELGTVFEQGVGYRVPGFTFLETKVHMCAGEIVDVELDIDQNLGFVMNKLS